MYVCAHAVLGLKIKVKELVDSDGALRNFVGRSAVTRDLTVGCFSILTDEDSDYAIIQTGAVISNQRVPDSIFPLKVVASADSAHITLVNDPVLLEFYRTMKEHDLWDKGDFGIFASLSTREA
jgi:hypothetical protein